jgi:PAS domain S-box-containing protein
VPDIDIAMFTPPIYRAEELELLVDAVQDYAIFLLSPEGIIRSWNKGAGRVMGYDESEVVGQHFSIFYGPEDRASDKPGRELQIAATEGRIEDEGPRVRKDGSQFWANTIITVMRDEAGKIHGFAKVTRDMTEKRAALEQLRQSSEIFQLLVSSVRDYAIFMLDPEGRVATWNAGAENIKQYKASEIIGRHFSTFYPPEDLDKPERELAIAREKGSVEDEGWRVRKDGSRFWANVVITAVRDASGELRGFAKVTRDITERKRSEETHRSLLEQREARLIAEEERRRAETSYRIAQEANRAKDEFLMTLSHELRTPMTSVLGWARLLPTMSPTDPLFREAIASIGSGAQLQARLIDDILDVSRIVSGKLRLLPETVEVARVIMNAVDSVNPTAAAKRISITTLFAPALGSIVVDPTRLQQIVWNLLSNAVKFTKSGGSVNVSARRTGSEIEISVADSGEGIDPEFLPHVFEPFRQGETPNTRTHGGLGLGLSIVRYIAEAHGGSVTVHSEGKGSGATFTVTLPILAVGTTLPEPESQRTFMNGKRLSGVDIVLVDDDDEARKMVAAVLTAAGSTLRAFSSAADALDAVRARRPAIMITDIAMPDVDGYSLAREIRKLPEADGMKIVALSAFPSATKEEKNAFDAYLSKPIDPFTLVDEVAKFASARDIQ